MQVLHSEGLLSHMLANKNFLLSKDFFRHAWDKAWYCFLIVFTKESPILKMGFHS